MTTVLGAVVVVSVAVIGVLVAAYVLGLVFSPASIRKRELEIPLVARLQTDAVVEVRLTSPAGSITLEKRGEEWIVPIDGEEYPAASAQRLTRSPRPPTERFA